MAITVNSTPDDFLTVSDCFDYRVTPAPAPDGEERRVFWQLLEVGPNALVGREENIANAGLPISFDVMRLAKSILYTPRPPLTNFGAAAVFTALKEYSLLLGEIITTFDPTCVTTREGGLSIHSAKLLNAAPQADESTWFGDGSQFRLMTRRPKNKFLCADSFDFIYCYAPGNTSVRIEAHNEFGNLFGSSNLTVGEGVSRIAFSLQNFSPSSTTDAPGSIASLSLIVAGETLARTYFSDCACSADGQILYFEPLGGWSVLNLKKDHRATVTNTGKAACYPVSCKSERRISGFSAQQKTTIGNDFYGLHNLPMLRAFAASPLRYLIKKNFAGVYYLEEFVTEGGEFTVYEQDELITLSITGTTDLKNAVV